MTGPGLPPRRSLPPGHQEVLRQYLLDEARRSIAPRGRRPRGAAPARLAARRPLAPWLAAVGVAAVTCLIVVLVSGLPSALRSPHPHPPAGVSPTAPSTNTVPSKNTTPWTSPAIASSTTTPAERASATTSTGHAVLTAAQARQQCADLVSASSQGTPPGGDTTSLRVRALVSTAEGTTVVIGSATRSWTCNLAPYPGATAARSVVRRTPTTSDFAVAENLLSSSADSKDLVWAGGVLPLGVSAVTFRFPDGRTTAAVIDGSYWVMQYVADSPFTPPGNSDTSTPRIRVVARTSTGDRTFLLDWGTDTCNQGSHGC